MAPPSSDLRTDDPPARTAGRVGQAPQASYADLVEACVTRLRLEGAHLSAVSPDGRLRLLAASDRVATVLALLQVHLGEGPVLDAWCAGAVVAAPDDTTTTRRWPHLARELGLRGISSAYAVPLHDPTGPDGAVTAVTAVLVLFADRPLSGLEVELAAVLAAHARPRPTTPVPRIARQRGPG